MFTVVTYDLDYNKTCFSFESYVCALAYADNQVLEKLSLKDVLVEDDKGNVIYDAKNKQFFRRSRKVSRKTLYNEIDTR